MAWAPTLTGVGVSLTAAWGLSSSDLWAAGNTGTILHWDGAAWGVSGSGTVENLWAMWGAATDDVWAAGDNGTILHNDGFGWTPSANPFVGTIYGLWGAATNDVWAVGDSGQTMHWDGAAWTVIDPGVTAQGLSAVWGSATGNVWAVGVAGVLMHWNGAAWSLVDDLLGFVGNRNAVFGTAANDVWVAGGTVGVESFLAHWNGAVWALADSRFVLAYTGGAARTPTDTWLVAIDGGLFMHASAPGSLQPVTEDIGYTVTWGGGNAVLSFGANDAWAFGQSGQAYRWTGGGIAPVPSTVPPLVDNFNPSLITTIQPSDHVGFDVTVSDGTPLQNVQIVVRYPSLATEESIYDGFTWGPAYTTSGFTNIANGRRYTIRRSGGWPASPLVKVRAVSVTGAINT